MPRRCLRHADTAMYGAKHDARDAAGRPGEQADEALGRSGSATRLRQAIERRELFLLFQPIVHLDGRRRRGRGAYPLAGRQQGHPPDGVHPARRADRADPADDDLDHHRGRCHDSKRWQADGCAVPVSINVLRPAVLGDDFVRHLMATAAHHGLDPAMFGIEVTESALMGDLGDPSPVDAARPRRPRRARRLRHRPLVADVRVAALPLDTVKLTARSSATSAGTPTPTRSPPRSSSWRCGSTCSRWPRDRARRSAPGAPGSRVPPRTGLSSACRSRLPSSSARSPPCVPPGPRDHGRCSGRVGILRWQASEAQRVSDGEPVGVVPTPAPAPEVPAEEGLVGCPLARPEGPRRRVAHDECDPRARGAARRHRRGTSSGGGTRSSGSSPRADVAAAPPGRSSSR
ncbi:MAG: EAL domain-containing protein [Hymenobacter sp.]